MLVIMLLEVVKVVFLVGKIGCCFVEEVFDNFVFLVGFFFWEFIVVIFVLLIVIFGDGFGVSEVDFVCINVLMLVIGYGCDIVYFFIYVEVFVVIILYVWFVCIIFKVEDCV